MPTYRKACLLLGWLAAALLAGISFFKAGSEPGSEKPTIAQLVADLGNDSFAKRENAAKEVDKIGAPALEALRKAAQSGDPEQRRRAEELVSRIEGRAMAAKVLAPKRVQLRYKGTRLADALADFQKQSGYSMTLIDPRGELKDRKISLDTGDVTFWQAFDQFCRKAHLAETGPLAPNGAGPAPGGPAIVRGARPGGVPLPGVVPAPGVVPVAPTESGQKTGILLTDGTPPTLSTDDGSAMRVRVRGAGSQRPGDRAAGALLLALEIQAEPKTAQPEPIAVHVRKAVDDAGQSLDQITNGGGYTGTVPSGALISLDLKKGAKASSSLAELSGTITVRMPADVKTDGKGATFDVPFTLKKVSLP